MLRNFLIGFGALAVLGLLAGWIRGGFGGDYAAANDRLWHLPQAPHNNSESAARYGKTLVDTGHFGPVAIIVADTSDQQSDEPEIIAFPRILSAAMLDGEMEVSLRYGDGTLGSARVGDIVADSWIVLDVSMQLVTAEQEGTVTEFVIYPIPDIAPDIAPQTP